MTKNISPSDDDRLLLLCSAVVMAQHKGRNAPVWGYGSMGKSRNKRVCHYWWKYKNVYAVGPTQVHSWFKSLYMNLGGSPGLPNVMAKVAGESERQHLFFPKSGEVDIVHVWKLVWKV